jgi:DNA-binding IclR family transcriptional regulator
VPSREQIVVIARIDPPGEIGLVVRVGHRRPMSQATSGHVLLAFQTDDVRQLWLDMIAAHEPELDRKKLLKQVTQVRARGYATAPSHVVDGVTDLSAPVLQHGSAVCALTIPFIERRASASDEKHTLEQLRKAATDISDTLQYGGPSRVD